MVKPEKVQVSERALLAADDEVLKKARSARASLDVGWYYVIDTKRNAVMRKDLDLQQFARSLEVLKDYEALEEVENG